MSGQVLELIIFAFLAFFIINKLISILGKTSTDEEIRSSSFFNEMSLKDVTHTLNHNTITPDFLDNFVVEENREIVKKELQELLQRIPTFDIENFMRRSKLAFTVIIHSHFKSDDKQLEELIDKRYIETFRKVVSARYSCFADGILPEPVIKLSGVYFFGNDIFIKVLFSFSDTNINSQGYTLHEEWTFSKSSLTTNPIWYLTDIDRRQQ